MGLRTSDIIPISEASARLIELASDVVDHGTEKLLTRNGTGYVALIDARKLDHYHALEVEFAGIVLASAALEGLEDMADGRVLGEAELELAVYVRPDKTA